MAHGKEDRVLEAMIAEEVLVEQQDADVRGVPGGDEPDREQPAGRLHHRRSREGARSTRSSSRPGLG